MAGVRPRRSGRPDVDQEDRAPTGELHKHAAETWPETKPIEETEP